MSSAIVNEFKPIKYQEQQETLAEVGAKAAVRCGLALGSITRWCRYMSNVDSTAKNRVFQSVGATNFTSTWLWTGPCFCMTPLFLLLLLFFNYLHLLYKSGKHWANTHWIKFPKQQVVRVGFPLYSNLFHYCITVTWHIRGPLWYKHWCVIY